MHAINTQPLVRQVMILTLMSSIIFIIVLGSFTSFRMTQYAVNQAENEIRNELNLIKGLLDLSYKNEVFRTTKNLELLEQMYGKEYTLSTEETPTNNVPLPTLKANNNIINNETAVMAEFTKITGFKAAVFARKGDDLYHVSTSAKKPDGTSLVGLRTPCPLTHPSSKIF